MCQHALCHALLARPHSLSGDSHKTPSRTPAATATATAAAAAAAAAVCVGRRTMTKKVYVDVYVNVCKALLEEDEEWDEYEVS